MTSSVVRSGCTFSGKVTSKHVSLTSFCAQRSQEAAYSVRQPFRDFRQAGLGSNSCSDFQSSLSAFAGNAALFKQRSSSLGRSLERRGYEQTGQISCRQEVWDPSVAADLSDEVGRKALCILSCSGTR
jgi:hypothetical protein